MHLRMSRGMLIPQSTLSMLWKGKLRLSKVLSQGQGLKLLFLDYGCLFHFPGLTPD